MPMLRRQTAGRSALREFRRLRRVAIREAWRDWALWLALVVGIFALAFFNDGFGQLVLAGCRGALLTVGVIGWLIGGHVSSLPWIWGAEGERHTAAELRRLPADTWRVFHDLADGKGNWNHVAVGPQGVYLIDSKTFHRPASVDDDGLRSGRIRSNGSSHRGQAVRLNETLQRETGFAIWAQSVFREGAPRRGNGQVVLLDEALLRFLRGVARFEPALSPRAHRAGTRAPSSSLDGATPNRR
jgi:hypothetical protein